MPFLWRQYPAIQPEHIAPDARLFAHRTAMMAAIGARYHGGTAVEIGVAFGDFSAVILHAMQPRQFVALDLFTLHQSETVWGKPTSDIFGPQSHETFYRHRFAAKPEVEIHIGLSQETLARFPDRHFDLIYVDADHCYEGVKADATLAAHKLAPSGTLVFNDYIMWDHAAEAPCGVVPAVNELVVESGFLIVGFAFDINCFCDIALRQPLDPAPR